MAPEWVREIREQCLAAEVPFFFKQWGGRTPKAGGRTLDDRTWDEMPRVATPTLLMEAVLG
jgi:protein gp37